MKRSSVNMLTATLLVLISLWCLWESREFVQHADIFPKILSLSVICLSIPLFTHALLRHREGIKESGNIARADALRPWLVCAVSTAYIPTMEFFGFFPASLLLTTAMYPLLRVQNKRLYCGIVAGALVFLYIFLRMILVVPLPSGLLGG